VIQIFGQHYFCLRVEPVILIVILDVLNDRGGGEHDCQRRHWPKRFLDKTGCAGFIAVGSEMQIDQRIATLQGKIIGITGIIELYQGKPQIEVMATDQIKGLNSQLAQ
jgi:hypothetical protein